MGAVCLYLRNPSILPLESGHVSQFVADEIVG